MKTKSLLLIALLWQSIGLVSAQAVDPVHQKYWLMRARFRDQFIVRGVDPLPVCEQTTSVYGLPIGSKKPYNDEVRYHKAYKDDNGSFIPAVTVQPGREDSCSAYVLGAVSDDYPLGKPHTFSSLPVGSVSMCSVGRFFRGFPVGLTSCQNVDTLFAQRVGLKP